MTVKELREQLDNYPDDLVIAIGYGAIEEDCEGNVLPDIVFWIETYYVIVEATSRFMF